MMISPSPEIPEMKNKIGGHADDVDREQEHTCTMTTTCTVSTVSTTMETTTTIIDSLAKHGSSVTPLRRIASYDTSTNLTTRPTVNEMTRSPPTTPPSTKVNDTKNHNDDSPTIPPSSSSTSLSTHAAAAIPPMFGRNDLSCSNHFMGSSTRRNRHLRASICAISASATTRRNTSTGSHDNNTESLSEPLMIVSQPHRIPSASAAEGDSMEKELTKGFTINKLKYEAVGLIGLEVQMQWLKECVDRITLATTSTTTSGTTATPFNIISSSSNNNMNTSSKSGLSNSSFNRSVVGSPNSSSSLTRTGSNRSVTDTAPSSQECAPNTTSTKNCNRNLVLIKGYSGTGKTQLALSIKDRVLNKGGLYVGGKFDFGKSNEPYSAIIIACRAIVQGILHLNRLNIHHEKSSLSSSNNTTTTSHKNKTATATATATSIEEQHQQRLQTFKSIQSQLIQSKGAGLKYLTRVLPEVWDIVNATEGGEEDGPRTVKMIPRDSLTKDKTGTNLDAQNQQIQYAFRFFFRLVCHHFPIVTIALDDLQWADVASLQLLKHLISDRENRSALLMIGCYRREDVENMVTPVLKQEQENANGDGVSGIHFFQQLLQELKSTSHRDRFHIEEMELHNLSIDQVNEILQALLSFDGEDDPAKTYDLAKLVHSRTQGNAFFVIVFITMLKNERLLTYNFGLMTWKWNLSEITESTTSTDNVVDLMKYKINKLPKDSQILLQLAACLGSKFEKRFLKLVWKKSKIKKRKSNDNGQHKKSSFQKLLDNVVKQNFLERTSDKTKYFWVHDKVQEAALSLIPQEELPAIKFDIGMSLYRNIKDDKQKVESTIFVLVNLLNPNSQFTNPSVRRQIAKLNLAAAQKAKVGGAFASAANYAKAGIQLLPSDSNTSWYTEYELTLELYTILVETEFICGRMDRVQYYCDEVLDNAENIMDKIRVYCALIDALSVGGRANKKNLTEANDLCLEVLAQLDCPLPTDTIGQTLEAVKTYNKLKKGDIIPSNEDVDKLEVMTDLSKIEVMKLLDRLLTLSYYSGNKALLLIISDRFLSYTMKYGTCDLTPIVLVTVGFTLVIAHKDYEGGTKLAEYGLNIDKTKLSAKTNYARIHQLAYGMVIPWTKPLRSSLKPLLEGYQQGLQGGDTQAAMWCMYFRINALLVTGKSLQTIEADCRAALPQMEEYNQNKASEDTRTLLQTVLNLMGLSPDVFKLTGEIMNEDKFCKGNTNPKSMVQFQLKKSFIYAYMGEYRLGAKLALKQGNIFNKVSPGLFYSFPEAFCRGISLYATARKKKKKKYKRAAMAVKKQLKDWLKAGNPNIIHYLALLQAEEAALKNKKDEASVLYSKAIALCTRGGFLHDAALANERYADFLFTDCKNSEDGAYYIRKAEMAYADWGAMAKVSQLHEKYAKVFSSPATTESSEFF